MKKEVSYSRCCTVLVRSHRTSITYHVNHEVPAVFRRVQYCATPTVCTTIFPCYLQLPGVVQNISDSFN
jgi:hypothetical protein